jgi:cysteinyl-tRNA synthetase
MKNQFVYNTLSRQKELFTPISPGKVGIYVCGMTVYDYCHLGHARVMVVFDTIVNWLRTLGFNVTYVQNITDIDDKIIQRALSNKQSILELTNHFIAEMQKDRAALGVKKPDHEPRATNYISEMQTLISKLETNHLAYRTNNGDVNFSVRDFPSYGKLSGKSLDDLKAGERVQINDDKKDPFDFVLWKAAKENEPDDAKWPSPWGMGRPGWHIECSAMSACTLGSHFDIHGGGQDLQFPHHENEIAQSEGAHQHPFANYWMHNGFVQIDNEKMSKSLGNFFTIRDILKSYAPEVVRFFIVRAHYRSPLNYSDTHLDDAKQSLQRLYTALKETPPASTPLDWEEAHAKRFKEAMEDDFNTPIATAILFELANEINKTKSPLLSRQLQSLGLILGLLENNPEDFLKGRTNTSSLSLSEDEIDHLIQARKQAKQNKNFTESDRIRAELAAQGVLLEDKANGITEWRRT